MKFFSKKETMGIGVILLFLSVASFFNFKLSFRRARDAQRMSDLGSFKNALEAYGSDVGVFPPNSSDGKLIACKGSQTEYDEKNNIWINLAPCEWGKNALVNINNISSPEYLKRLPIDPQNSHGYVYFYLSDGKRFQIFASLEGNNEAEYNLAIAQRKLMCGHFICNAGKASGGTPLDKSLEQIETELIDKTKN